MDREMIGLSFGALAHSIASQLPGLKKKDASHFQRDADAITRLSIRGLMTDGESHRARQRLVNKIALVARVAR